MVWLDGWIDLSHHRRDETALAYPSAAQWLTYRARGMSVNEEIEALPCLIAAWSTCGMGRVECFPGITLGQFWIHLVESC